MFSAASRSRQSYECDRVAIAARFSPFASLRDVPFGTSSSRFLYLTAETGHRQQLRATSSGQQTTTHKHLLRVTRDIWLVIASLQLDYGTGFGTFPWTFLLDIPRQIFPEYSQGMSECPGKCPKPRSIVDIQIFPEYSHWTFSPTFIMDIPCQIFPVGYSRTFPLDIPPDIHPGHYLCLEYITNYYHLIL